MGQCWNSSPSCKNRYGFAKTVTDSHSSAKIVTPNWGQAPVGGGDRPRPRWGQTPPALGTDPARAGDRPRPRWGQTPPALGTDPDRAGDRPRPLGTGPARAGPLTSRDRDFVLHHTCGVVLPRPSRKRASATRKPLPTVVDGTKMLSRLYRASQSREGRLIDQNASDKIDLISIH